MKLQIGNKAFFEIRKEKYLAHCKDNFSLLYLSDLHFNRYSGAMAKEIVAAIQALNPTIILWGGDLVDTKNGLIQLDNLVTALCKRDNMFAIAGNHDYYFGISKVKEVMMKGSITWIEKKSFRLQLRNTTLQIDGNCFSATGSEVDFSILLLHKPIDIPDSKNYYNLALAGHLHGCQVVFWESNEQLFPGRFFYKWNVLKRKVNSCLYLVSKGLGDTLPIRYNCKKDILFVDVLPVD
jgi:uncharacterized protein